MRTSDSFLVDWWHDRLFFERQKRELAHVERAVSQQLLAMYNKPQAIINEQKLYDRVMELLLTGELCSCGHRKCAYAVQHRQERLAVETGWVTL